MPVQYVRHTPRHPRRSGLRYVRRAVLLLAALGSLAGTAAMGNGTAAAFSDAGMLAVSAPGMLAVATPNVLWPASPSPAQDLQEPAARVNRELVQATALYFACFGIYVFLAVLFLTYWRWVRRDLPILSVGVLSLAMAVHTAAASGSLPFLLPALVDVDTGLVIESVSYVLLNGFIAFMLWAFFPASFRPRATGWMGTLNTGVAGIAVLSAVLFAMLVLTAGSGGAVILALSRWFTVLLMIVVAALAMQSVASDRRYGSITAAGLSLLVIGSMHDVLFAGAGSDGRPYLVTFAVLGFLLLQTYVVLRRSAASTYLARLSSRRLRRDVEARTKELRAASVAAQAVNMAKTEFVTAVTHELRTPLASLIGYVDLIRDEVRGNLAPHQVDFFDQLELSAQRLLNLVNNLLDLAKIESGRIEVTIEEVNVADVVRGVRNELYPMVHAKGLYLETDVRVENVDLRTDEQWLSVVLANLVSNAVKYTEEGGVTIRAEEDVLDGRPAVAIKVIDTGPGISSEFMPLLFHRFTREERARGDAPTGSGLGLTIARELLDHLGGRIDVESQRGEGSTFTILLPASGPAS